MASRHSLMGFGGYPEVHILNLDLVIRRGMRFLLELLGCF